MPRVDRSRWLALSLSLLVPAGCVPIPNRAAPKPASALLDSGPTEKVTERQAADVQYAIGRSHEEDGRLDQAEAAYRSALARDPARSDIQARLAIVADRKGDPAGSALHFDLALKIDPRNPEILCDRGYGLYLRRRFAEAEASLRAALAADRSHARSHNNLGLVLAAKGQKDAALAEFARAGCDGADARSNLGLALAMEGKYAEAREQYALAVVEKPGSTGAKQGLKASAVALAKAGGGASARLDPALMRTSASPAPPAQ